MSPCITRRNIAWQKKKISHLQSIYPAVQAALVDKAGRTMGDVVMAIGTRRAAQPSPVDLSGEPAVAARHLGLVERGIGPLDGLFHAFPRLMVCNSSREGNLQRRVIMPIPVLRN